MRNQVAKWPLAGLFAVLLVTTVAPAEASFIGFYDVSNWATTISPGPDGSVDTTLAPGSVTLTSANNGVWDTFIFPSTVDFTIAAAGSGTVSFTWNFRSDDADGPGFDPFGYLVNGLFTQLTSNNGPAVQSGIATFAVSAGDVFGFRQASTDSVFGPGVTTVSYFSAPVPEPTTLALLGLGLLGGARRLRNRQELR